MSRLISCFDALKHANKKALIPYITAGCPTLDSTVNLMHLLVESGADVIELGVPFSEPYADGPVIEKAHEIAVANGVGISHVFSIVSEFRKTDPLTPIVLMSYLNPIEIIGYSSFAEKAKSSGIDALLVVDCPPEESIELVNVLNQEQMDMIFLISPNTSDSRIMKIQALSSGYVYYVSMKGVTGSNIPNIEAVTQRVTDIKQLIDLPVAVGFGVKDAETAALVSKASDAVIVGSVLVKALHEKDLCKAFEYIADIMSCMRKAIDEVQ